MSTVGLGLSLLRMVYDGFPVYSHPSSTNFKVSRSCQNILQSWNVLQHEFSSDPNFKCAGYNCDLLYQGLPVVRLSFKELNRRECDVKAQALLSDIFGKLSVKDNQCSFTTNLYPLELKTNLDNLLNLEWIYSAHRGNLKIAPSPLTPKKLDIELDAGIYEFIGSCQSQPASLTCLFSDSWFAIKQSSYRINITEARGIGAAMFYNAKFSKESHQLFSSSIDTWDTTIIYDPLNGNYTLRSSTSPNDFLAINILENPEDLNVTVRHQRLGTNFLLENTTMDISFINTTNRLTYHYTGPDAQVEGRFEGIGSENGYEGSSSLQLLINGKRNDASFNMSYFDDSNTVDYKLSYKGLKGDRLSFQYSSPSENGEPATQEVLSI